MQTKTSRMNSNVERNVCVDKRYTHQHHIIIMNLYALNSTAFAHKVKTFISKNKLEETFRK